MNDTLHLPFTFTNNDFSFEVDDLPTDHPAAQHGWPGATLTLLKGLGGDDSFVRTLTRVHSIEALTIQLNPARTQYTFLAHPNLRTNTLYTPTDVAMQIRTFVDLLKERIQWRSAGKDRALVSSTSFGVFVTLRGFSNIKDAIVALKKGAPNAASYLTCISEEDCTFEIVAQYKNEVTAYFN